MLRCTSTRVPAVHTWPDGAPDRHRRRGGAQLELGVGEHDVRALAAELEATRFTRVAAAAWMRRPVSTDPVNEIASTPAWSTSGRADGLTRLGGR